jgi:hypothetical protein
MVLPDNQVKAHRTVEAFTLPKCQSLLIGRINRPKLTSGKGSHVPKIVPLQDIKISHMDMRESKKSSVKKIAIFFFFFYPLHRQQIKKQKKNKK